MTKSAIVFGSGGGSNFRAIFEQIQAEQLSLRIDCVISNNSSAKILEFAKRNQLNTLHFSEKKLSDSKAYETAFHKIIDDYQPHFIILAGFMKMIPVSIIKRMPYQILNIHPALLPAFGGHGMYGMNVHNAVYAKGVKLTGATIHFVTEHYDEGPIILQESVSLTGKEAPENIAEKVLKLEHQLYPKAIQLILSGNYKVENNRVILLDDGEKND